MQSSTLEATAPAVQEIHVSSHSALPKVYLFAIAILFPLIHGIAYPYAIYFHPDTFGVVLAGEALAKEGKAVQPFHWDYLFEIMGKKTVSVNQSMVSLDDDHRVPDVLYPPGYTWIVAAGTLAGFKPSTTCQIAFYGTMLVTAYAWLLWGQRVGVPLSNILIGLLTLLLTGPATVTDPFGWLVAAVALAIVTYPFRLDLVVLGTCVIAFGDLIRHAAILVGIAWFGLWMTRRITLRQRIIIVASCVAIVAVDTLSKKLRSGSLDPLSMYSGSWPTVNDLVRGAYYALLGGWSPVSPVLKGIIGGVAILGAFGVLVRYWCDSLPRWIYDLLIVQLATAFVLSVAQYKYGADFTQSPIAIARYWHYCTPGLICLHIYGFAYLIGRFANNSTEPKRTAFEKKVALAYGAIFLLVTGQWIVDSRAKWSQYVAGPDGFARKPTTALVHIELQKQPLLAVLTDNHQLVYSAVPARQTKCIYYMSGFSSTAGGQIALVTTSTERGKAVLDACNLKLTPSRSVDLDDTVSIKFFELPPGKNVHIEPAGSGTVSKNVDHQEVASG